MFALTLISVSFLGATFAAPPTSNGAYLMESTLNYAYGRVCTFILTIRFVNGQFNLWNDEVIYQ